LEVTAAVIVLRQLTVAVILVPIDATYPEPGARLIAEAQRVFPTLPIMLVSPRVGGFSRSYAHFDVAGLIDQIDTSRIAWRQYAVVAPAEQPLPF
jgi:hypothetical protein